MLCNLTTDILDQVLQKFVSSEKTKQNKEYNSKIQNKKQEMQLYYLKYLL